MVGQTSKFQTVPLLTYGSPSCPWKPQALPHALAQMMCMSHFTFLYLTLSCVGFLYIWNSIQFSPVNLCHVNLILTPARTQRGRVKFSSVLTILVSNHTLSPQQLSLIKLQWFSIISCFQTMKCKESLMGHLNFIHTALCLCCISATLFPLNN